MFCIHWSLKKRVPHPVLCIAAAGLVLLGLPAHAFTEETVAVVNNVSITRAQYERSWPAFLKEKGIPPDNPDGGGNVTELKKELLESLVDQELLYQEAVREGYGADVRSVEKEYARVCRPFRSEEDTQRALRRSGFTSEGYREYLHRRLTVESYLKDRVTSALHVEPEELEEMLQKRSAQRRSTEKVHASHILIRVPLGAGEKMRRAARQEAEEVVRLITEGADFDDLARKYSDCPSSEKGGDLGLFSRGTMSPPFEEAAFGLQPGEVSDVVETSFGFHIIRVEQRRDAREASLEELEGQLRELIRQEKIRVAFRELANELRGQASVQINLEQ